MANMHLVTGYAGKAHVTAADQGSLNAAVFGGGAYVLPRGNRFSATIVSNNTIRIADGDIMIQGRHARLNEGSTVDLTIANGTQGYRRNDLIVARYTKAASTGIEAVNLVVIKGTPKASNPADPAYNTGDIITNHAATVDVPLYRVPLNGLNVQELVPLFTAVGAGGDAGISVYTHTKSGAVHNFTGSGSNGRALITAAFASGDSFAVNGVTVPAYIGGVAVDELPVGRWMSFIFDGTQLNFNGGGGLSNAKLAAANAIAAEVVEDNTFYSGSRTLKSGNLPRRSVVGRNGAVGINNSYPAVATVQTGAAPQTNTALDRVAGVDLLVPRGFYDGTSYLRATNAAMANAIGLTTDKLMAGNTVLGVTGSAVTKAVWSGSIPHDYAVYTMGTAPANGTLLFLFAGSADHDMQIQSITIGGQVVATPWRNNLYVATFPVVAGQQITMQWASNYSGGTPYGQGVICYV